jgi:hypothetical protein
MKTKSDWEKEINLINFQIAEIKANGQLVLRDGRPLVIDGIKKIISVERKKARQGGIEGFVNELLKARDIEIDQESKNNITKIYFELREKEIK